MADFLRSWIMNITVIIIFVMFLDTVMPNNAMKRYINVIVGLLIIMVVIRPFVLVKDYADSFNSEFLEAASFVNGEVKEGEAIKISKYQNRQAVEIFEENLKGQIINTVKRTAGNEYKDIAAELELVKDFESEEFGKIKSVSVHLSHDNGEVIEVNKIKIAVNEGEGENKNVINKDKAEYNLNDSKISSAIKDEISKALGISESIVNVKVLQK